MKFDYTKEPGRKLLDRELDHSGEPLVSIITPYYNAGKYFEQTYNSVMNQTFPWFEWVIVDDGSTDSSSLEVLEDISKRDERIRVFHKENGGISTARNRAIRESRSEIVIPLDADDLIEPTYVETLYWALYYNPDCSWAYTNCIGFQNLEYTWDKPFDPALLRTYNFLTYSAGIRKKDALEIKGYDEVTKHYFEDWRFWLKMLTAHKKPVKAGNYGFWYRRLDTGVLSQVNKDPEVKKLADRLISEVAKTADIDVKAKEYPAHGKPGKYIRPSASDFDRRTFRKHEKTNVLMLIPWMEMGGADKFNLDVCAGIDKDRFELGIITTQQGDNSWQQSFAEHVTDIFNLPEFLDEENWPEFISYYIRSREVDVVFLSNSYYGYYLVPWLRKEFPELAIIDYVHMEEWYWRAGGYARTSGAMGDILEKTYVCNERTRRVMINDFGRTPESVETLYIGVDKDKFDETAVEYGKAKKELGIAEDRPMILFPCRIHPQKRPFLMPEIAKEVKKAIPDVAFVTVGDGPQLEELKQTIEKKKLTDTVYLAGRQSDMRPWYKDCDMTLICSLKEGLALTAYESLSMGRPVVTSDVGGQAELIDSAVGRVLPLLQSEEEELDSREFSKEEIRQYADAITEILRDKEKYREMSKACRSRIEEGFSTQVMIEKLEKILVLLTKDESAFALRAEKSKALHDFPHAVDELPVLMGEIDEYERMYKYSYSQDAKNELMRIANSKWGRRLIKVAFKLRLNRLF